METSTNGVDTEKLAALQTEGRNSATMRIDEVTTLEMCEMINEQDSQVHLAVQKCMPEISKVIDLITPRLLEGGRVVYLGSGTSGRLGVLDASEIPPTFSAPPTQFLSFISGGDTALRTAVENAEDSPSLAVTDLLSVHPPLTSKDSIIGIAASGRTPYVLGALNWAKEKGCVRVGLSCVSGSELGKAVQGNDGLDVNIECVTGAEVVTGSTRMKAGTACKMILNMISTSLMIKTGKTYGNMMVDVKTSNLKLIDRSHRILRTLLSNTPTTLDLSSPTQLNALLDECGGSVKLALVVARLGCSVEEGKKRLSDAGGVLKAAWAVTEEPVAETKTGDEVVGVDVKVEDELVVCIDAGGTKCAVVISGRDGVVGTGVGGPCNFATTGVAQMLINVKHAILSALPHLTVLPPPAGTFKACWIGMAGCDRPHDLATVKPAIATLLSIPLDSTLVSNDAALTSAPIASHDGAEGGCVLIAGTGSIGFAFSKSTSTPLPVPLKRAGGYGYMIGDEGSGYTLGIAAIKAALEASDEGFPPTALHLDIARHFGCEGVETLLSAVYSTRFTPVEGKGSSTATDPKARVAGLARLIFTHAFPSPDHPTIKTSDKEAVELVRQCAREAAQTILAVMKRSASVIKAENSVLVMGGGLSQVQEFRDLVTAQLWELGEVKFGWIEVIGDVAMSAAEVLVKMYLQ